jgi:uncharacterized membrane protein YagU involved in acid resistance
MNLPPVTRALAAGLLTGITDGTFASVLAVFFFGSSVTRLFQGVASTVLGASSFEGGTRTAGIGLAMHFGVALGWSFVFLLIASLPAIRQILASPGGVYKVAAVYGPCIWLVMSLIVIPLLLHRPPTFTVRWLVQWIGHFPFVGLPIVYTIWRRGN